MTNGEKLQQMFPNAVVCRTNGLGIDIGLRFKGENWIAWFDIAWWNAEYKESEVKE